MPHAQTERALACDALRQAGPSAPTLCEGWDVHDLAAHLWVRENESHLAAGLVVPRLAGRLEQRRLEVRGLLSLDELVAALRVGPPRLSPFGLPGADEAANTVEYFVHGEDVRRANPQLQPHPRDPALEDALWRQLAGLGRLRLRRPPISVVLERSDTEAEPLRFGTGGRIATVIGPPTELTMLLSGRRGAARVEIVADEGARDELARMSLAL